MSDREYWVIANWFGWMPEVLRSRVIESDDKTALVRSGDLVKVVSTAMVFGEEWRANDALADIHDRMARLHRERASATWTGRSKPVRLRQQGGA